MMTIYIYLNIYMTACIASGSHIFVTHKNHKSMMSSTLKVTHGERSYVECASRCTQTPLCVSANYDVGTCEMYNQVDGAGLVISVGSVYMFKGMRDLIEMLMNN